MGYDPDELPDDFLLPAGGYGSYRRGIARFGVFVLADGCNTYGRMCIPRGLGIPDIPAEPVYGKFDDLLSGIVGVGRFGQRRNAVLYLPPDAEKCQSSAV